MDTLALKLIVTPALIGVASLVGRRWGPMVSGWLVGLPLTSGPVVFFLALSHGTTFAAAAAIGILAGTTSQVVFCLTYGWLALRWGWLPTMVASSFAFATMTGALQRLTLPVLPLFLIVIAVLIIALRLMPAKVESADVPATEIHPPRWDLPARMAIATGFVLLLTGIAPALGPRLTGLLAPFPIYASILAIFAQRMQGPAAAIKVLRGLLLGLFASTTFFAALAVLIEHTGIAPAFAVATIFTLTLQASTLWVMRQTSR